MLKTCSKCGVEKEGSDFGKEKRTKCGTQSRCKSCILEYSNQRRRDRKLEDPDYCLKVNESRLRWKRKNSSKSTLYNRGYRQRNPDKYSAHREVKAAVEKGLLVPLTCCQSCDSFGKTEGHHEDYSRPLDVVWLCVKCHKDLHRRLNETHKDTEAVCNVQYS